MTKFFQDIREVFIKRVLFVLMGFFCYCYTLFGSDFAEWELKFRFLNFPIFVGEFLLFVTLMLVLIYFLKFPKFIDRIVLFVLIFYVLWIVTKTGVGYVLSGPLALRNAALFYYPLFAVVGYVLFDRDIFKNSWRWVIPPFLLVNLFFASVSDYFVSAYWLLALAFCLTFRSVWGKWLCILVLATYAITSKFLFLGSRSHMIGIACMSTFLVGYFIFGMIKIHWRTKLWLVISLAVLVMIGLFSFGDHNALRSMISFKHLREQYTQLDQDIERGKKYYVASSLKPQIYDQNRDNQLAQKVFNYARAAGQTLSTGEKQLNQAEVNAIDDSAKDFMIKAMEVKQATIHKRADEIYKKTRDIMERQNSAVIEQAKSDLDADIQRFLNESDEPVEKDLQEALQNLSLALHHDTERSLEELKKSVDDASQSTIARLKETAEQKKDAIVSSILEQKADRSLEVAYNNIFFRIFIWRDMIKELKEKEAWWGVDLGQPQRSPSIEILGWATVEWQRDGWITPHNSFLHMIYRGGIIGGLFVLSIIMVLIYLVRGFLKYRSITGGLLVACLMYWIGISNFLVFLELPYNSIPFWTFFGMTLGYLHTLKNREIVNG